MKQEAFRMISSVLVAAMLSIPVPPAQARMFDVDHLDGPANATERAALIGFVERADVARELQLRGVDARLARERIEAMTDSEVQALSGAIETAPAGGFVTGTEAFLAALGIVAIAALIAAPVRNAFGPSESKPVPVQ